MIYLIFLIATIIRFYRLDAAPYWYDEAFTGLLMRLDLPALLDAIAGDTHPPLYYLLVWLVTRVIGAGAWRFNPRSPWGERRTAYIANDAGCPFQSTLPVGGATVIS